jgi:RecB family exonuclease
MNSEEFEANYTQILDTLLNALANSSEVKPEKFYSLACRIEKLQCLNPVFYDTIRHPEDSQS